MKHFEATAIAKRLLNEWTFQKLSKNLGISIPTIYTRLKENNWKLAEMALLDQLKNKI